MFILCLYYVYIISIWGLSKIMVPETCPYTALSRTFRALSCPSRIGTWDCDQVFVRNFVTKIFTGGLYLKHSFGHLTSGHWFCTHSLKNFWSCDIAERTSPFWARVGSGRTHLSRTFRGPFANLSRISRLKNNISETNVYARVSFTNLCQSMCARANRARKNAKHEYDNLYIKIVVFRPFANLTPHSRGLSPLGY